MGDRATLEKIYVIMRGLLLIKLDGLNPIPRKGTTRRECYRALYEIQELLETRRYFGKHLPQTNGDRIRAMSDEELAERIETIADCNHCPILEKVQKKPIRETCRGEKAVSRYSCMKHWLDWLREESTT